VLEAGPQREAQADAGEVGEAGVHAHAVLERELAARGDGLEQPVLDLRARARHAVEVARRDAHAVAAAPHARLRLLEHQLVEPEVDPLDEARLEEVGERALVVVRRRAPELEREAGVQQLPPSSAADASAPVARSKPNAKPGPRTRT
jgi:hypothetical protein